VDVFSSTYLSITYFRDTSLLKTVWFSTIDLTDELFKSEMRKFVEIVEKFEPHNILIDTENFEFTMNQGVQIWIANEIFPLLQKAGVKKAAFIVSKSFIPQLSLEQHIDDDLVEHRFQPHFFDTIEDAKAWLISNGL